MSATQFDVGSVMYKLKPQYITSEVINTPDCMYKLTRIYNNNTMETSLDNVNPEVAILEKRQIEILERLDMLKIEVDKLTLGQGTGTAVKSQSIVAQHNSLPANGVLQDLVINANPKNPPFSLLVLYELLLQQYKVLTSCYVHSSVSAVPTCLKGMFADNGVVVTRTGYHLALSLIWKNDVCGTSMMLSPNIQTAVYGEANVARYLARLLSPAYDSMDSIISATEIDNWLDLATQIIQGNNKERAAVLRTLNAKLGKSSWLVGSELSLADIMLWSALQQNKMTQAVPANVKKWLESCNQQTIFKRAVQLATQL